MAVAVEFEPFSRAVEQLWPADVLARYRWPGLFWAESVRIKYAMRERLGETQYISPLSNSPVQCEQLAKHPTTFAELAHQMGGH